MIRNLFILFKIGRVLSKSNTIEFFEEIYKPPILLKLLIKLFGVSFSKPKYSHNVPVSERLSSAFKELGPTFIKLGQFLGTRPDIVGESFAKELQKLQDTLPPFDTHLAKESIKKELGNEFFGKITEFSPPIAAASIAQVHFAKINHDNKQIEIAIKVLRPNIEKIFNEELEALMLFASIVENLAPKTQRLKLVDVVHLLKEITAIEMDLRFEAAAANELKINTKEDKNFEVPEVFWDFTSKRVLSSEKVNGIPIKNLEEIGKTKIDKKELATDVIQSFLLQAVRDGFFHGDMHQGNLFVNNKGKIIPVDFGIMGRLDKANKKYLAEILYGFIERDYEKVADVHFRAGLVPANESKEAFSQALRSIGEPIFGQKIKNISAGKLLAQLFEITEKFNMTTQPQLLLLQKTMVVVEGVARSLDENANIWQISRPVLEKWLRDEISPKAKLSEAINTTSQVFDRLPELPKLMDKASQALELLACGASTANSEINKSIKIEKLKLRHQKYKVIISFLSVVILLLVVLN